MRLLLDTHSFLWFIAGTDQLSSRARDLISDFDNEVVMSVASLWEIAIKTSLGKLRLSRPFEELIPEQLEQNDFEVIGIEMRYLSELLKLPLHHRDPFDRLIIAQAVTEQIPIVSRDPAFQKYSVQLIW